MEAKIVGIELAGARRGDGMKAGQYSVRFGAAQLSLGFA